MANHTCDRRLLLSALALVPFAGALRPTATAAQTGPAPPPIVQPDQPTRAGFFARARALREQACARATRHTAQGWCATA